MSEGRNMVAELEAKLDDKTDVIANLRAWIDLMYAERKDNENEIERLRAALREIEHAHWDTEMIAIARAALEGKE